MALSRSDCGQAVFEGCDPETCTRDCFTARAIDINERYQPRQARDDRLTLIKIAVAVPLISFIALYGIAAAVDAGRSNIKNWMVQHEPV